MKLGADGATQVCSTGHVGLSWVTPALQAMSPKIQYHEVETYFGPQLVLPAATSARPDGVFVPEAFVRPLSALRLICVVATSIETPPAPTR